MNSDKIASVIMIFLFLSSILASSGCLEDKEDNVNNPENNNDYENPDDNQNNNGDTGNQDNNGENQDDDLYSAQ